VEQPCTSQEKGERGDDADKSWHEAFPFQGELRSQIAIRFKATDKLITRVKHSEDWRAIRLLHLRATAASGVGLGFDGRFGHYEFTATIAILAEVDLAFFGHGLSGDPESWISQFNSRYS